MVHEIDTVAIENLLLSFYCVFAKGTSQHFPLLGSLGKQL